MTARLASGSDTGEVVRLVSALLVELGGKALEPGGAAQVYGELIARPELGFVALGESAEGRAHAVCTVSFVHARASGCPFVELGTPQEGARQIAFYRRSGFVSIGERLRCAL